MSANKGKTKDKLSPNDKALIQGAIEKVRQMPADMDDEKAVLQIHRIRKALVQAYEKQHDPVKKSRKYFLSGLLISFFSAFILNTYAIIHYQSRYSVPQEEVTDPVVLIIIYSVLLAISAIPFMVGIIMSRKEIKKGGNAELPKSLLLTYDVAVVKGLLRISKKMEQK